MFSKFMRDEEVGEPTMVGMSSLHRLFQWQPPWQTVVMYLLLLLLYSTQSI